MGDDKSYLNTQVAPGGRTDAIPVSSNSLAKILEKGPTFVRHLEASSPVQLHNLFGVKEGSEADLALVTKPVAHRSQGLAVQSMFARGDRAYDAEKDARVTVLKTSVGFTPKGTPIHKVADRYGDTWLQRENKLRKR